MGPARDLGCDQYIDSGQRKQELEESRENQVQKAKRGAELSQPLPQPLPQPAPGAGLIHSSTTATQTNL